MQLGRRYDPLYGKCSAASATTQSRSCIAGDVVSSSVWQMYIEMINGTFITQILCTERLTAEKQTVWRMRASLQTSTRSCRHTETCSQHCQSAIQATLSGIRVLLCWATVLSSSIVSREKDHPLLQVHSTVSCTCRSQSLELARQAQLDRERSPLRT